MLVKQDTTMIIEASLIAQFVISRIVNFYENLAIFLDLFTALNTAATSYLVKIKVFIVALMQYTADEQDSAVHSHSRRSRRGVMGVRMVGIMQYQIAASIHNS